MNKLLMFWRNIMEKSMMCLICLFICSCMSQEGVVIFYNNCNTSVDVRSFGSEGSSTFIIPANDGKSFRVPWTETNRFPIYTINQETHKFYVERHRGVYKFIACYKPEATGN